MFLLFLSFNCQSQIILDTNNPDDFGIEFVGQGNLQNILGQNGSIPASTGLGVIYKRNFRTKSRVRNLQLEVNINIASTVDTIKGNIVNGALTNQRDFGNGILTHINSGQSAYAAFKAYLAKEKFYKIVSGLYGDVYGSNRIWNYNKETINASVIGGKVGVFHEFIPSAAMQEKYSIYLGFSFSFRRIAGDIGQKNNDDLRNKILGMKEKYVWFGGPETNLGIRLKNLKAEVSIPYLMALVGKDDILGLTSMQFVTTISFIGGFPLKLN